MPNVVLIPKETTRIAALSAVVNGFADEVHKLSVSTGDEALEDGTEVSDHAVARQEELSLTGYVSSLSNQEGITPTDAMDELRRLHKEVEPVEVISAWGLYQEMLIVSVEASSHGLGMRFTLSLRQILRVGIEEGSVTVGRVSGPAMERTSEVRRGRVPILLPDSPAQT